MVFYLKKHAYGIRGNIYDWFKGYLKKQYIFYDNTPSYIGNITHGVCKGSILGPLVFILYMNDFLRASNLLFLILYADDTNIFIEGTEYHKVISNNKLKWTDDITYIKRKSQRQLELYIEPEHYSTRLIF